MNCTACDQNCVVQPLSLQAGFWDKLADFPVTAAGALDDRSEEQEILASGLMYLSIEVSVNHFRVFTLAGVEMETGNCL